MGIPIRRLKGFTLIELLIVIAIIAILTVAFLPTLRGGQGEARDAARKAELNAMVVSVERILNGEFPALGNTIPVLNPGACLDFAAGVGQSIRTALARTPTSPSGGIASPICTSGFFYRSIGTPPTNYLLVAQLELTKNGNLYSATNPATVADLNTVLGGATAPGDWNAVLTSTTAGAAAQRAFWVVTK